MSHGPPGCGKLSPRLTRVELQSTVDLHTVPCHEHVVPVDDQDWSTDPFTVVERDGRLYGRGTADMKSFSAIALALVPEFLARGLETPIHLALSYDEEVGCLGAPLMIVE